ncbi:MAG: ribonuclease R [Chthoniobacterales bacterium]
MEARLLELLASPKYQPLAKTDLAKRLNVPVTERGKFRKLLIELEANGRLAQIRKDRYVLPSTADLFVGVLQVNPQGFGYIINESGDGLGDLYIAADNVTTAMHGDRVVARIIRAGAPPLRSGRQRAHREGRIVKILKRANETIVGTLQRSKNFFYVVPDEPCLIHDIYVQVEAARFARAPEVNDKVVVRLEPWEHRHVNPEGEIIEVLGPASAPGVAILSIIKKYELPTDFPEAVLEEARSISSDISEEEIANRTDLRAVPVFTIDPDDARDFDDAIHVQRQDGEWEVGIHIADVSHYVKPGRPLDREAYLRGNSVYFPDRVLPMLPERLSNGVCSLRPDEDHLTKSVIVRFDHSFRIRGYRFAATVIRSRARLTYGQAIERLRRPPGDPVGQDLHHAWQIAERLRERRFAAGALELDIPEVRVQIGANGVATGVVREENDISHQLIEEFMLLANEVVASETKKRPVPSVYRIHEDPDPTKLLEFRETVRAQGIEIGDLSHRREVQRLLKKIAGRPEEVVLRIGLLRSLRRACYSPEPVGHYGLAKSDYTHFTSPIRRYADLIVHRAFNVLLAKGKAWKNLPRSTQLPEICEHISLAERIAADAEREAVRLKKLEYLRSLIPKPHRFEATIIEVRNYGLMVEVGEMLMIGLVHISSLADDFFIFDPARQRIYGRKTKASYAVGDRVIVRVAGVDAFKRQVDFVVVSKTAGR